MDKKKKPAPALAYGAGQQQSDRQKTKDYYFNEAKKLRDKPGGGGPDLSKMFDGKNDERDENYRKAQGAYDMIPSKMADQGRWIARGAKANALAKMKLKKKPMSEAQKKKIYGGE